MFKQPFTFLNNSNAPATGLTVAVTIYDLTASSSATQNCVEVGNGIYVLEHSSYDPSHDYIYFADAGSSISNRYAYAANASYRLDLLDAIDNDSTSIASILAKVELLERIQRGTLRLDGTQIILEDEI